MASINMPVHISNFLMLAYYLSSEIVKFNHLIRNAQIIEHFENGIIHHWRTTEIILNFFRFLQLTKILIIKYLVNESCFACPVIFRNRFRKGNIKIEIWVFISNGLELILVENFPF